MIYNAYKILWGHKNLLNFEGFLKINRLRPYRFTLKILLNPPIFSRKFHRFPIFFRNKKSKSFFSTKNKYFLMIFFLKHTPYRGESNESGFRAIPAVWKYETARTNLCAKKRYILIHLVPLKKIVAI